MISPPFRHCPACGKGEFDVHPNQRESVYAAVPGLLAQPVLPAAKATKENHLLDQFVVSNLMKLDNPGFERNDRLTKETF